MGVEEVGRPVKWVATRSEAHAERPSRPRHGLSTASSRSRERQDRRPARTLLFRVGAYFVGAALAAGAFSVRFIPEAYDNQTMFITTQGLFTHTAQNGPYRGAGRPEAAYFTERLIEEAARKIGMDTGRDPPPQPDPAEQAAVHDANLLDLRQRRLPAPARQVRGGQRLEGIRARARRNPRRPASCAAAP